MNYTLILGVIIILMIVLAVYVNRKRTESFDENQDEYLNKDDKDICDQDDIEDESDKESDNESDKEIDKENDDESDKESDNEDNSVERSIKHEHEHVHEYENDIEITDSENTDKENEDIPYHPITDKKDDCMRCSFDVSLKKNKCKKGKTNDSHKTNVTTVFEELLHRPPTDHEIQKYKKYDTILKLKKAVAIDYKVRLNKSKQQPKPCIVSQSFIDNASPYSMENIDDDDNIKKQLISKIQKMTDELNQVRNLITAM